jgi:DNA-binding CsgD family transcriptional regulator
MTDRDQQIIALREQGMTYGDIGARFSLTQSRVADIIGEHRPALTGVGLASARADAVTRLRRKHKTLAEIAAILGLSVSAVSTIITKHSPSLTGRRRGYASVAGDLDRLHRNLKMLLLRREGITYRALGKQFGLTASAAREIVASLERLFTGPRAMRALQSKNALRNLQIIHLRRRRLSYPEIGARVGLSKNAVNYVVASIAPSLTGRELARRDLDLRRSSDEMPKISRSKVHPGTVSRQGEGNRLPLSTSMTNPL